MKNLILVMVTLFSFTSQARSLAPDSQLHGVELSEDAKVLQITIQSQFGVSCPQSLDLKGIASYNENLIIVNFADNGSQQVGEILSNVSQSCKKEIFDFQTQPRFQCLSYGIEEGTVYVSVENLQAGTLMISLPLNYEIKDVVELK